MQCPKCDHQDTEAAFGDPAKCPSPSCGVYYAKALAHKERMQAAEEKPAMPEPKPAEAPQAVQAVPVANKTVKAKRGVIAACAILVLAFIWLQPYLTVYQIRSAAKAGDAEALAELVDFPAVRESLRDQFNAKVMASAKADLEGNPFAAFGMALASTMVDKMVTVMVTPDGLASLLKGNRPALKPESTEPAQQRPQRPESTGLFGGAELGYEGLSKFVVTVDDAKSDQEIRFILRRDGFGWRLKDLRLPL